MTLRLHDLLLQPSLRMGPLRLDRLQTLVEQLNLGYLL